MTTEVALLLLAELHDLELRAAAAGARLPHDQDVANLRRDIQSRRAAVLDVLVLLHQVDDATDARGGVVH